MNRFIVVFVYMLLLGSCSRSVMPGGPGQEWNWEQVTPFDSTIHYRKLFADRTEFDVRKFKPLSTGTYGQNKWALIDAINPVPGYVYWECRYLRPGDSHNGELVVYHGDKDTYSKDLMTDSVPKYGFFVECFPNICYSYINAINSAGVVYTVDDEDKLTEFMGDVDNIAEVLLHIKANGYWYDKNTLIGGAYREQSDHYLLYIMEYSGMPVTYRSVKAILYKTGKFEVVSKVTYRLVDAWVMS